MIHLLKYDDPLINLSEIVYEMQIFFSISYVIFTGKNLKYH